MNFKQKTLEMLVLLMQLTLLQSGFIMACVQLYVP